MTFDAARFRPTRRTILFLVVLTVVAVVLVLAYPHVAARRAERRTAEEAKEIGDALVKGYIQTRTYPRNVVADNTDGNHPEVLADGRPLPGVTLAPGMAIYYYAYESRNLGMAFCLEHRPDSGQPNAFAVYSAFGKAKEGAVDQTDQGYGCLSAE